MHNFQQKKFTFFSLSVIYTNYTRFSGYVSRMNYWKILHWMMKNSYDHNSFPVTGIQKALLPCSKKLEHPLAARGCSSLTFTSCCFWTFLFHLTFVLKHCYGGGFLWVTFDIFTFVGWRRLMRMRWAWVWNLQSYTKKGLINVR